MCFLTNDVDGLHVITGWAKPTRKPDYNPVLPDEFQYLYLILGSLFQDKASPGFKKLLERITSKRHKELRLLAQALVAIEERDQEQFEKSIDACVRHHMTKPKPGPSASFMEDWLPLHANTIYLAGLELGLGRPDYPAEIAAYLMTPESVGFGA